MILDFLIHKLTEYHPPEVVADRCINHRVKDGCSICKECCPENAVNIEDNRVVFNEQNCNLCGICKANCPTQAIKIRKNSEAEIIAAAAEKKNLVVACSLENKTGNLSISCLNSLHPELIAYLFIMHKEKKLHFNLSNCAYCKLGHRQDMFEDSLSKAVKFTNKLGIDPAYEIHSDESELSNLVVEEISRRNLFKLIKKESSDMVVKTVSSIVDGDDSNFSLRNMLLNSIKGIKFKDENNTNIFWEYWDVSIDCDGCGKCMSICPGKSWKLEKDEDEIRLYHKAEDCYKCGACEKKCPKKAITKSCAEEFGSEFKLKRQIKLSTCRQCNKKFIPSGDENECDVCKKKELLRRKISAFD